MSSTITVTANFAFVIPATSYIPLMSLIHSKLLLLGVHDLTQALVTLGTLSKIP